MSVPTVPRALPVEELATRLADTIVAQWWSPEQHRSYTQRFVEVLRHALDGSAKPVWHRLLPDRDRRVVWRVDNRYFVGTRSELPPGMLSLESEWTPLPLHLSASPEVSATPEATEEVDQ